MFVNVCIIIFRLDTRYHGEEQIPEETEGMKEIAELGDRKPLEQVKYLMDSGYSLEMIADKHFGLYLRHERALKSYQLMKQKKGILNQ